MDPQTVGFTDQIQTAVREVFAERGLNVNVSIAIAKGDDMCFEMAPFGGTVLTQLIVDAVMTEAAERVGATPGDGA